METPAMQQLETKVRKLIEIVEQSLQAKQETDAALGELQKRLDEKEEEIREMNQKYETLKLAKSLTGEQPEKGDARLKINNIVRELDRCIALLNQ